MVYVVEAITAPPLPNQPAVLISAARGTARARGAARGQLMA